MIDPLLSLAHSVQSNKGVFGVLLGSGVSRAAGIPTGWEVTLDLARRLAVLEGDDPVDDLEGWYIGKYGKPLDYSRLLDALAGTQAERRRLLHDFFEATEDEREQGLKEPTEAHRAIARLVARGYVKVIVTTNFDRLMERALRDEGIEPTVISTSDGTLGATPIVHQRCVVLKLHGDYLDDRIKNTEAELATYDPAMSTYLDRVLDEFGFIICGWSGEWDPALRAAFERSPSRRYTTYWACNHPPGPKAVNLISLRQAQVLTIKDADTFFTTIEEKVASLEELRAPGPLSVSAAVASLKRYIADPRQRVRLHDLVMDEINRVRRHLTEEFPVNGMRRTEVNFEDEFRQRARGYEASTEILRHLFFHGGFWAEAEQQDIFTRGLQMIVPPDVLGGVVAWLEMQKYPATLLLYAAGMGAIANGNFRMLKKLFSVNLRHRNREQNILETSSAMRVMEISRAQVLYGEHRHTPMSDYLVKMLMPMASILVSEPEFLFDTLEIMIALAYLDRLEDLSGEHWMPPGRFCWQGHFGDASAKRFFVEVDREGSDWVPLKAGMFGGDIARLQAVRAAFDVSLLKFQRVYW
jgi:hypothetical protein